MDIRFFCDSINTFSDLKIFVAYFHIDNYSNNDVTITINNKDNRILPKSFVYISPHNNIIPFYRDRNRGETAKIKNHSTVKFEQIISSSFFADSFKLKRTKLTYTHFLKTLLSNSKIDYYTDMSSLKKQLSNENVITVSEKAIQWSGIIIDSHKPTKIKKNKGSKME